MRGWPSAISSVCSIITTASAPRGITPPVAIAVHVPGMTVNAGTWLARRRPDDGGYVEHRIGTADDFQDDDGVAVLGYGQAQKAARDWWRTELRREEGY